MNSVCLIGNLTRDIELKYTPGGTAVANVSVAVNKTYTKDGEKVQEVSYFDVTVWAKSAENCEKYLSKGSKVAVTGELKQERWDDDGTTKSRVKIVANRVEFLDSKKKNDESGESEDDGASQI